MLVSSNMTQIKRSPEKEKARRRVSPTQKTNPTMSNLSALPAELVSEIMYWLRAELYPEEQRSTKALLAASKHLRLTSRHLSEICLATFVSNVVSHPRSCDDDRRIRYHMSFASLKIVEAIMRNDKISPFIHEIEYVAFDLQKALGTKEYTKRISGELSLKDKAARWNKAYALSMKCVAFYAQHQHLLRIQKDRRVLEKAKATFVNLRRVKFTRMDGYALPRSFKVAKGFYGARLSDSDMTRLKRPLYLNGFFNLARMAIGATNVYGVTLNSVVPDLALSSKEGQGILQDLFKRITTARIYFAADNFDGLPLCRKSPFPREVQIWQTFLNGGTWISKMELGISHSCKQFNNISSLFDSIVVPLQLPRLRKLYLENVLINRADLRSLVINHGMTLKRIYMHTVSILLAETYDADEIRSHISTWFDLLSELPVLEKCRDRYGFDCVQNVILKPVIQAWLRDNVCSYHRKTFIDGLPQPQGRHSIDIGAWVVLKNDLSEDEASVCSCTQRRIKPGLFFPRDVPS